MTRPEFKLHHIGVAVDIIDNHRDLYLNSFGYSERTPVIHDPVQTAYVQFFVIPGADHYLELVAPDGPQSKLAGAARKTPLNHLCYSVPDIEAACGWLSSQGGFVIQEPVPAVAFEQRRISWVMMPGRLLVELVERGLEGEL